MKLADPQDLQIFAIIDATMEIHRQLGYGFLKAVYKDAAVIEFSLCNIPFQHEVLIPIKYKDHLLPTHCRADFVCFSDIFVEFKAIPNLSAIEEAQVLNYLKATGMKRGLLINFGYPDLQYKSLISDCEAIHNSKYKPAQSA
jgi:GxxExxY protein